VRVMSTLERGTAPGARRLPRRPLVALTLLAVVAVTSASCALFVRSPEVVIADVRVVGLGLTGGTAEILLEVDNPNRFGLEVREFRYLLEVSDPAVPDRWDTLAVGVSADTVRLESRASTLVPLRIPFRYSAVGTALRAWTNGGEVPYRLEGAVRARGAGIQRDLPFRSTGSLTP
jgi:LEA14-like dessication related protein